MWYKIGNRVSLISHQEKTLVFSFSRPVAINLIVPDRVLVFLVLIVKLAEHAQTKCGLSARHTKPSFAKRTCGLPSRHAEPAVAKEWLHTILSRHTTTPRQTKEGLAARHDTTDERRTCGMTRQTKILFATRYGFRVVSLQHYVNRHYSFPNQGAKSSSRGNALFHAGTSIDLIT